MWIRSSIILNGTRKHGPRKNGPREKWSPENWSPEKCPAKIVLRQKNARKFERLFHFYQLIPLHTQKDVWRLHHDPTYAPNCRTLKESRMICCRVLGFHRLIRSENSTHTPRCSTLTPPFFVSEFWVYFRVLCLCRVLGFHRLITSEHSTHTHHDSRRPPHDFSFLSFRGTNFPGPIFPGFSWTGRGTTWEKFFALQYLPCNCKNEFVLLSKWKVQIIQRLPCITKLNR